MGQLTKVQSLIRNLQLGNMFPSNLKNILNEFYYKLSRLKEEIGINDLIDGSTADGKSVFLGDRAGNSATSTTSSIGIGMSALEYLTDGSSNVAIGSSAGKILPDGTSNTNLSSSVLIGSGIRTAALEDTNEIVIGDQAVGKGSNTTVLGNDSVERTYLKGGIFYKSLNTDPVDPEPGESVIWVSDGTGTGNAGDVLIKINVAGTVKIITLVDFVNS